MLFKMEFLEGQPGEELVYQNPYPKAEVLLASSPEGTENNKTAFVIRHLESAAFKAGPGFVLYGRTRLQK